MSPAKRMGWSMVLGGVTLLGGLAMAILGARPAPQRAFQGGVQDLLPKTEQLPGWTVEHLPIASTPEMQAKVNEELNYTDAAFVVYTRGALRLSVYIAYWEPGKMLHRLVATHTPDVCWVGSGWVCEEARSHASLPNGRGGFLLPAEQRVMTLRGNAEHVVFWHLLNGVPMSYGTRTHPPWHAVITDLFNRKLDQRPEQFFVRISSNRPVEEWGNLAEFPRITGLLTAP